MVETVETHSFLWNPWGPNGSNLNGVYMVLHSSALMGSSTGLLSVRSLTSLLARCLCARHTATCLLNLFQLSLKIVANPHNSETCRATEGRDCLKWLTDVANHACTFNFAQTSWIGLMIPSSRFTMPCSGWEKARICQDGFRRFPRVWHKMEWHRLGSSWLMTHENCYPPFSTKGKLFSW